PLAGLLVAPAAAACTTSWADPAGGAWSDPAHWSDGVPGLEDIACISLACTYTVTLDVDAAVRSFVLGGPMGTPTLAVGPGRTLAVSASSFVGAGSVLEWTGGTILTGSGLLHNAGLLRLTGGDEKRLGVGGAATLVNQGTVAWGGGALRFGDATVVKNNGLFDVQGNLHLNLGGPAGRFENRDTGVLRKSAGAAISFFFAFVENHGLVESLSGSLQLSGGSRQVDARLEAAAGAEVLLYDGTHTVFGTLSGSPAGTVAFISPLVAEDAAGAALDFAGTGLGWGNGE